MGGRYLEILRLGSSGEFGHLGLHTPVEPLLPQGPDKYRLYWRTQGFAGKGQNRSSESQHRKERGMMAKN